MYRWFYIGAFVLNNYIEPVGYRLVFNELVQYKTAYLELTFAHSMLRIYTYIYSIF